MTQVLVDEGLLVRLGTRQETGGPEWLQALRATGRDRFNAMGLPTTRMEEWRLTNVGALGQMEFAPGVLDQGRAAADLTAQFSLGQEGLAAEVVFINGHYAPQLSRVHPTKGVRVESLRAAWDRGEPLLEQHLGRYATAESQAFVALNTAALSDGAWVHIARNAIVSHPIHLLFLTTCAGASHPRVLVVAEENAQATLVESYAGPADSQDVYLTNAVTEIVAAERAQLDHYKLQQESKSAFHLAAMQVQLGRSAAFVSHAASLGSKLGRNDLGVLMGGEYAEATLNGLVIIDGDQHIDNHTLLDHALPNCPSHELYKHVLAGRASGVFKGKILVRQDAQKTDSKQTSKSLLLSNDAIMDSQPALEIYADDVKCTHGSTTGPLDEEMAFYLRSRGVSLEAARHLLAYAFAADITRRIKVAAVRERLENIMAAQHGLPQDLRITDLAESYVPLM